MYPGSAPTCSGPRHRRVARRVEVVPAPLTGRLPKKINRGMVVTTLCDVLTDHVPLKAVRVDTVARSHGVDEHLALVEHGGEGDGVGEQNRLGRGPRALTFGQDVVDVLARPWGRERSQISTH